MSKKWTNFSKITSCKRSELGSVYLRDFIGFSSDLRIFRIRSNLLLTVPKPGCTFTGSFRFLALPQSAQIAQLAEHPLGKGEVDGSNPFLGSRVRKHVGSGF